MCVAAATSAFAQGQVLNDQLNLGEIFSEQTLNVVTVQEGVAASTSATGNNVDIASARVDLDVTSNQVNQGAVYGHAVVNASGSLGASSTVATSAAGNFGNVGSEEATYRGFTVQTNSGAVTARGQIEGETARAGDIAMDTQASGNTQGLWLQNGAAGARISQANSGDVLADGGAIVQYVSGTSSISGTATGNHIDVEGANQSAARVITDQGNTSDLVQASKFAAYGNAYLTDTSTAAMGNNLNATNTGPLLDVANHQYNTAYVRSQAETTSYQFGAANSSAYGVGNAAVVSNTGAALVLDNVQTNDGGGVEVIASAEGHDGYDIGARASAAGNSVSGYVCGTCGGSMTTSNTQTNNADISSRAATTVTGSARSITSTARAVGNDAAFYVRSN
ncbi:holin [Caulobacter flavus]|uniref:Holin n=1 Tax=Caulobacter flavus TaxID=1679497 RepID=A0A2N5CZS5_9CAUL|nr:holin [Caulobacter flavus]PLR19301.1 holin [Caulobacter flavus]